jgi:hypothetical protein
MHNETNLWVLSLFKLIKIVLDCYNFSKILGKTEIDTGLMDFYYIVHNYITICRNLLSHDLLLMRSIFKFDSY